MQKMCADLNKIDSPKPIVHVILLVLCGCFALGYSNEKANSKCYEKAGVKFWKYYLKVSKRNAECEFNYVQAGNSPTHGILSAGTYYGDFSIGFLLKEFEIHSNKKNGEFVASPGISGSYEYSKFIPLRFSANSYLKDIDNQWYPRLTYGIGFGVGFRSNHLALFFDMGYDSPITRTNHFFEYKGGISLEYYFVSIKSDKK